MSRLALLALLLGSGCRISLDSEDTTREADAAVNADGEVIDAAPSAACREAETYQNLANIESKIFRTSCTFRGCHNGEASDAGAVNMLPGKAFASLVNKDSKVSDGRKLVVPGNAAQSYLLIVMGQLDPAMADPPGGMPPADIGLMPQDTGNVLLCPQKRAAIERWIVAGALND